MPPNLGITEPAPLSLVALLLNLLLGTVLAIGLSWHYTRFGRTKSNRAELAQVFPLIVLTTILVISVVKSSLALSLGLVGALSIVRFRTPIKEPEELSYLFMAIAIGLGLGADQRLPTLTAYVLILTVLATMRRLPSPYRHAKHNLYLNIEVPQKLTANGSGNGVKHDSQLRTNPDRSIESVGDHSSDLSTGGTDDTDIAGTASEPTESIESPESIDSAIQTANNKSLPNRSPQHSTNQTLAQIHEILSLHTYLADMRRLDASEDYLQATYYINCRDSKVLIALIDNLQQTLPQATISCVEQRGIPEV
ncbi:hypothetical protein Pse7367_3332 [Thalassoporum mexicanum PCC 7367]|uniref:DUF4956 domain-containing protein n=1 Tax=Thalassoporum mexicanum TaxID=3457544 RepID=UPI00029FD505|nr:DUF4956 domain-containing protein [Pseudanabaena sp. PCC 7367]AFY71572.1 hypothetical protein Pse7367_3332 [Pseudanabaena sp. PCC 7367]